MYVKSCKKLRLLECGSDLKKSGMSQHVGAICLTRNGRKAVAEWLNAQNLRGMWLGTHWSQSVSAHILVSVQTEYGGYDLVPIIQSLLGHLQSCTSNGGLLRILLWEMHEPWIKVIINLRVGNREKKTGRSQGKGWLGLSALRIQVEPDKPGAEVSKKKL